MYLFVIHVFDVSVENFGYLIALILMYVFCCFLGPGGSFAGTAKLELTAMKSMEAMYSCEAVNPLSNRTKVSNAVSLTVVCE